MEGTMYSADFGENTITLEIEGRMQVMAGRYKVMPIDEKTQTDAVVKAEIQAVDFLQNSELGKMLKVNHRLQFWYVSENKEHGIDLKDLLEDFAKYIHNLENE